MARSRICTVVVRSPWSTWAEVRTYLSRMRQGRPSMCARFVEWKRLVQEVKNGISYLRNRLTGNCEPNYDCTELFQA
eukprot:597550-Prymnesium_polylepis.1